MKKLMIMLSLISLFFSSCTKTAEGTSVAPKAQQQSKEGGITSGGGGILPADAIAPYEVFEILKQAKTELRLFFNRQRSLRPQYIDMKSTDRFFYQDQNLLWALENTDLEYYGDKPCYDEQGLEVDGSYLHAKPNSICISGFTTASKLILETVKKEIYALIIHELAHRVGANEVEARELQRSALSQLPDFIKMLGDRGVTMNTMVLFEHPLFESNPSKSLAFQKLFNTLDIDQKIEVVSRLKINSFTDVGTLLSPVLNGSIDYKTHHLQMALERGLALLHGALLLEKGVVANSTEQMIVDFYKNTFSKSDEMSLYELGEMYNQDMYKENIFAKNLKFKKIKSSDDYQSYLEILKRGYGYLGIYRDAIVNQNALPALSTTLFEDQHPWVQAVGVYQLTQKNCEIIHHRFVGLTGLEVILNSAGHIDLKFIRPSSSVVYGDITNQDDQVIFKDGKDYVLQFVVGDRWPNEIFGKNFQQIDEIKLSDQQMIVTYKWFSFSPVPLNPEIVKTCVYDVIKQ